MSLPAFVSELLATAGVIQAGLGCLAVHRFRSRTATPLPAARPAVTVLKPLHGDEPKLEEALASLCAQDYPEFQIVFGVQATDDSALPVLHRLRASFPDRDIAVVIDRTPHGENRKVANLINMYPAARHDVLVIADSDVHATPDYLDRLVAELAQPGVGLATVLYTGLPGAPGIVGAAGATALTHGFLPGALLARWLGRQDCLGATMALRRDTLIAAGGMRALADHVADDHVLGKLVRDQGLEVRLADTVCATTVPETTPGALFRHELRWARTILGLAPLGFVLSSIQYPLFWAALSVAASGGRTWTCGAFLAVWAARGATACLIDAVLHRTGTAGFADAPVWLLPLRDIMSVLVMLASYGSNRVEWRGQVMHTGPLPDHIAAPDRPAGPVAYPEATGAPVS